MGVDIKGFVEARNKAMTAFVLNDDWEPIKEYCNTYGIEMPDNPDVMAAGIYKAVQEIPTMPNEVKDTAMIKCLHLGFTPFIRPYEPKEDT